MKSTADVLRDTYGRTVSEHGERCADLIVAWVGGIHHFPGGGAAIRRAKWDGRDVTFTVGVNMLETHDGSDLTRLVFLAHDHAIRVALQPAMTRIRVVLSPRERDGETWVKHPTLEAAVAKWRERNAAKR